MRAQAQRHIVGFTSHPCWRFNIPGYRHAIYCVAVAVCGDAAVFLTAAFLAVGA
jgi:hypothetical protein